jgi:ABC-type lipoprotein export system ATPase subunit
MIEISELEFSYPDSDFRLSIPHLRLAATAATAVIGASGAGKTTLLHLLAGILVPDRGSVCVGSQNLSSLSDVERRDFRIRNIGLVFQDFELLEYLTVLDNILLPYRINPSLSLNSQVRARARELAGRVGIEVYCRRYPSQLSQGERQRVALCRALVVAPGLVLADEPTGNLDPMNKKIVVDMLLEHCRERSATLIAVTHDHELLPRFANTIDLAALASRSSAAGDECPMDPLPLSQDG